MFFDSRMSRCGAIERGMLGSEVIGECGKPVDLNVGRWVAHGLGQARRSPIRLSAAQRQCENRRRGATSPSKLWHATISKSGHHSAHAQNLR